MQTSRFRCAASSSHSAGERIDRISLSAVSGVVGATSIGWRCPWIRWWGTKPVARWRSDAPFAIVSARKSWSVGDGVPLELPGEPAGLVADGPVEVLDLRDAREEPGDPGLLRPELGEGVEDLELVVGLPLRRLEELEERACGAGVADRAERADGGKDREPVVQDREDFPEDLVAAP